MSGTKTALITGITGQDGAYLAELLLIRGTSYTACGGERRCSIPPASTIYIRIRTSPMHAYSYTTAT